MFWKTPTVTIRGNKFDAYQLDAYWKGMEDEQDRIIKLLEPIRNGEVERPFDYYDDPFGLAIALIKGEDDE